MKSKWIKCSERMPREGEWLLMYFGNGPYGGMDRYRAGMYVSGIPGEEWMSAANAYEMLMHRPRPVVTHWMPLPDKPEEP